MLVQQHDLTRQVETITANLRPYIRQIALNMTAANPENGQTLCEYMTAELTEKNISDNTREWKIKVLTWLSKAHNHRISYREMTKADILFHLNALRKPIEKDADKRWIGTYNNRVLVFTNFFRWLTSPDEPDQKKRKTSQCMKGVKQLPRKSKTSYKPSDLWTPSEHDVFLRYCPLKRDRCYHAMARDTSARPHELLKLRIGGIQFKIEPSTGRQYAEVLVSGKTGTRTLPLIDSIPYIKEWIAEHPERDNPNYPLFITLSDKNRGNQLSPTALLKQYKETYHAVTFPRLLEKCEIPNGDKDTIRAMLKKPWKLYVQRHSALTEKAKMLTEATLRNHAGWTMTSKMPGVYIHFFGAESSKSLLEARGIITKDKESDNILRSKSCPHCQEPNTAHATFCNKCKMVLTYEGYAETQNKFQEVVNELGQAQMDADLERDQMMEQMKELRAEIERLKIDRK